MQGRARYVDIRSALCPARGEGGFPKTATTLTSPSLPPIYSCSALRYHDAYETRPEWPGPGSSPLVCVVSDSVVPRLLCKMYLYRADDTFHIPPFFRLSSALAFLADNTSGASVFSGSAVWMKGC